MKIRGLIRALFDGALAPWHDKNGRRVPQARLRREYAAIRGWVLEKASAGEVVAINLDYDYRYLLCILACMEAGVAYLPLRPAWSPARINQIRRRAGYKLVLDPPTLARALSSKQARRKEPFQVAPESPLYLMCTSGTTGEPKIVVIKRTCYEHYLRGLSQAFAGIAPGSRLLFSTDFTFDFTLQDIGLMLLFRAAPYFSQFGGNIFQLAYELETYRINIAAALPNTLRMLLRAEVRTRTDLSALRWLTCGGSMLSADLHRDIKLLPKSCSVYNVYGPTEITVASHFKRLSKSSSDIALGRVSVGKPMPGANCLLVDSRGRTIKAPLKTGELWLGGPQLMRGYVDPDHTAASLTKFGGATYYKTQDIAFRDKRGEYHIVGRAGETLKRRGFRVDLQDIDAYIRAVPGVFDSCTLAYPHPDFEHFLVGCVVLEKKATQSELRARMKRTMLSYQIPDRIEFLENFPLTDSGKIDRVALEKRLRPR